MIPQTNELIGRLNDNIKATNNEQAKQLLNDCVKFLTGESFRSQMLKLKTDISGIEEQLKTIKDEFSNTGSASPNPAILPEATSELNEVTKSTEESTNAILDSCEKIQKTCVDLPDSEQKQMILDEVTQIFESCNFHDINWQRITKVVKMLSNLESNLDNLKDMAQASIGDENAHSNGNNRILENGPQKAADAPSQDDIDDLFDNM